MLLKKDCIHFPGDRPCIPHKTKGIMCNDCKYYVPAGKSILIIKLDAIGDVLRTTSILHSLKKQYPEHRIKWLTRWNAKDLFLNNDLVSDVLIFEDEVLSISLAVESFDVVINLDPSPVSASLASYIKSNKKIGFGLDEKGKVYPFNKEAVEWFEMGAFDNLKKANKKTYQQIIHEICSLPYKKADIILNLNEEEKKFRNDFFKKHKLNKYEYIIGINAGASDRWQYKKWNVQGYKNLLKKILKKYDCAILLFGSGPEDEANKVLKKISESVIDTGMNSLRNFIALMDIPQLMITGDTLALHVATALKKKIICLFGPTSYNEIEDYGRINKVYPEMDCLVCYKPVCDFNPACMDLITDNMVFEEVKKILM
jgi:heptosyltransferase-2